MARSILPPGATIVFARDMNEPCSGSDETIKQGVMAGMGIGFLSAHTVQFELQAKRLVTLNVAGFPIVRKWYLVHRNDKRLSPVARTFKQFLLEETAVLRHAAHGADDTRAMARQQAG